MSNAILSRIQAKSEELGPEQAAKYYSGDGPGKKMTPAQLQRIVSGEDMPTPRMCLKVCEDLEAALVQRSQSFDAAWESANTHRIESDHLKAENVNLAAERDALLDEVTRYRSQQNALSTVQTQAFPTPVRPFMEVGVRQPWDQPRPDEMPVRQPWGNLTIVGRGIERQGG